MTRSTPRDQLVTTARDMLKRLDSGEATLAPEVMTTNATTYADPQRFAEEERQLFRRIPLMLAASCELPESGHYKTLEVAGLPVLLARGRDRQVRAFLNSCTHRGSMLAEGSGKTSRFTCPYHAWTFSNEGDLIAIASQQEFGDTDKSCLGLTAFTTLESAGLIWVVLDPQSSLDIAGFLGGFDRLIENFNLADWQLYDQCSLDGANWKLAFDAHLEFYHLPVLHRDTFGAGISNQAQYYFHGPHQRLGLMSSNTLDQDDLASLKDLPEAEWPTPTLLFGEWIVFPNVSLNCYVAGQRVMVISQVFPGSTVKESHTVQTYLVEKAPSAAEEKSLRETVEFIKRVVRDEDLPMSRRQQKALSSGLLGSVQFGRNEAGLQHYHAWLERILATGTADLDRLFQPDGAD